MDKVVENQSRFQDLLKRLVGGSGGGERAQAKGSTTADGAAVAIRDFRFPQPLTVTTGLRLWFLGSPAMKLKALREYPQKDFAQSQVRR